MNKIRYIIVLLGLLTYGNVICLTISTEEAQKWKGGTRAI